MRLQLRDCRGRSDTRDDQVFGALLENPDVIAGRLAAKYSDRIGLLAQARARVFAEEW
jgi:hypothetical protein